MNASRVCPIWGTAVSDMDLTSGQWLVDSPRAGGRYGINRPAMFNLRANDELEKARLTSWLVEQRRMGVEYPTVTVDVVEDAIRRSGLSPHERADRLLRCLASEVADIAGTFKSPLIGAHPFTYTRMAFSESTRPEELEYLMSYLRTRGWVSGHDPDRPNVHQVSVEGYSRIADLEETVVESSKAFVAMWFDDSMREVWEKAIKPGIEDAGYDPVRIDRKEYLNKIDDEIISELKRARFVVADFTHGDDGPRGGVYYEAGFAHGKGRKVVFTCENEALKKIHLDTRQYNHIAWEREDLEDFRHRLATRISAVIGDGPRKS